MTTDVLADPVAALSGRLFSAAVDGMELASVYLGAQLGLYRELADRPATPAELADRTGHAERYLREWLTQQALAGFVTADGQAPATARYALSDGVETVLVDETSPAYLGGLPSALAAVGRVLPALVEAYRTGAGVPYAGYGPDAVSAQAALNRPAYVNALVADWLPKLPEIHRRLADPARPARVGDFGCGSGWSAIELARAFPHIRVDGFDNDEASIAAARRNAAEHGVAGRVDFEVTDLSDPAADWSPRYDVIFFFECLHDLPRPVEALTNAKTALRDGGTVIVMDERTAATFATPADPVERFFAVASTLWCLPQGLVGPDPEPAGALMRASELAALATRAGYADSAVVDIDHPFWRFYRLVP